jgi:4-diphosphocytidyl-2-C-methyl-D-erythritol kinase
MGIVEPARAKINLTLAVLGRRTDGYHELDSLVTFAACGDQLQLIPGRTFRITVTGPFARAIVGPNLLERTAAVLRGHDARLQFGAVVLEKNLPVAAGLGGGSADAAALLRAVRRANPDRAAAIPWERAAREIGADVPMCLASSPARAGGIGEELAPLELPALHAVLANPRLPLATARVFAALWPPPGAPRRPTPVPPLRDLFGVAEFMRAHPNALEGAATALLPDIAEVKAELAALPGCCIAAMSGSGPTCFALFASSAEAVAGATLLATRRPGYWVVATELAGGQPPAPLSSPC